MSLWQKIKQFFEPSKSEEPLLPKTPKEQAKPKELIVLEPNANTTSEKEIIPENSLKTAKRQTRRLNIGFDFGTSYTKAVIREHAATLSWPIKFGQDYLLPSKVFLQHDKYSLNQMGDLRDRLKWRLMNSEDDCTDTIAFIALALREIKKIFTTEIEPRYLEYHIEWSVNIGIPSITDEFEENYKKALYTAYSLAFSKETISKRAIQNHLLEKNANIKDQVYFYPEIFAEVYGYSKSPNRKDGLYFIFDIGATTLDAAIFNLFLRNYEEKISIFSAFVESYGTYRFIEMVNDTGHLPQFATLTPFDNFPGNFLDDPVLLPVKEKFRNEVFQILKDLIIKARINYPTAHNWYNPQFPRVANNPQIKTKIFFLDFDS
jgi:hypothetical protein